MAHSGNSAPRLLQRTWSLGFRSMAITAQSQFSDVLVVVLAAALLLSFLRRSLRGPPAVEATGSSDDPPPPKLD